MRVAASARGADGVTPLTLDAPSYEALKARSEWRMTGFALDGARRVDLDVRRVEAFSPGAHLVTVTAAGEAKLPRPDMVMLVGTVVGWPDSSVFLSLSPHGTRGWVAFSGDRFVLSSGPGPDRTKPVIYDYDNAVAAGRITWGEPWTCGLDNLRLPAGLPPLRQGVQAPADGPSQGSMTGGGAPVYNALVAVETDFEFTNNVFGGNSAAATAYVATIFAAASEIYTRDVGTNLEVTFLRLWETGNDPWTASGTSAQLSQFRSYWNAFEQQVFRHVTHFLSGRGLGGGVAYLDAVCEEGLNYGLSANLGGFFPFPLQTHHPANWDIIVVTHELGHNFGSVHTHNMSPPVDNCGNGNCTGASNGTIMSYCHLCGGGISNIDLRFHERVIFEQILPFLQFGISCDISVGPASIFAQPEGVAVCDGGIARLSVGAGGTSPISLQWRKDGVDIPGATGPILTLDPVSLSNAGSYDVFVTNPEGSATSDPAIVGVAACGPPSAEASGCRALRVTPPAVELSAPVAFTISAPSLPCLSSYISLSGELVDVPEFHPAPDWSELVLSGEAIIPGTDYHARMDYGVVGSPRLTAPAVVTTERWGDVAGLNVGGVWGPPDGEVVVDDILADISCFANAVGAPPRERCDLYPAEPDGLTEIADILQVVRAFSGLAYPFPTPGCD